MRSLIRSLVGIRWAFCFVRWSLFLNFLLSSSFVSLVAPLEKCSQVTGLEKKKLASQIHCTEIQLMNHLSKHAFPTTCELLYFVLKVKVVSYGV